MPLLDHPLVEFVATIPADVKFQGRHAEAHLEDVARRVSARRRSSTAPTRWVSRRRWTEWLQGTQVRDFVTDVLTRRGRASAT